MNRFSLVLVSTMALSACMGPTTVSMEPVSGSRSDGTIVMQTSYNPLTEQISWSLANNEASSRCRSWGYARALPFNDTQQACYEVDSYSGQCREIQAVRTYQCSVN